MTKDFLTTPFIYLSLESSRYKFGLTTVVLVHTFTKNVRGRSHIMSATEGGGGSQPISDFF